MARHNPKVDGPLPQSISIKRVGVALQCVAVFGKRGEGQLASYPAWMNRGRIPSIREVIALHKWH